MSYRVLYIKDNVLITQSFADHVSLEESFRNFERKVADELHAIAFRAATEADRKWCKDNQYKV